MVEDRIFTLIRFPLSAERIPETQARVFVLGLQQHHAVAAKLIALCCNSRGRSFLARAQLIFSRISRPSVCVWNAYLRALAGSERSEETLKMFLSMRKAWIKPDRFTFPSLLQACSDLDGCLLGCAVHGEILKLGIGSDGHVNASLIDMYSRNGKLDCAVKVFEEMRNRDAVVWNCMLACFFRGREILKGREIFERMPERNTVSWNTVISGYLQNGFAVEALEIFRRMQIEGWVPSEATFVGVLSACSQVGALCLGKWVHRYIELCSIEMSLKILNSLIDMYAKGGSLETARKLFDGMPKRNVVSWNCMIRALAMHGHGEEAVRLFEEMQRGGTTPDGITFVGILTACAHAGFVDEGRAYFDGMQMYGIVPQIEHYGCMIDILCRGGQISEAYQVIKSMSTPPDAGIWGALLSACRRQGRLDLAEDALVHLLDLEPWNAGNYVVLSNMLAARGSWSDVECVRIKMKKSLVGKTPGSSSIETEKSVREFVSGDHSHPRSGEIYLALEGLDMLLKLGGDNDGPIGNRQIELVTSI